jgi:ACR3 family arsenite efflux pump ArsB
MALGFGAGLLTDTSGLARFVLPVAMLMIYPTMIGFGIGEVANLSHVRLLIASLGVNFVAVPILAYALGVVLLAPRPELFAGLAIASLLPTSNMTIAFTMLGKGNVPAAVNLTVISLILGALLSPWYLLVMVGQSVPLDVGAVFQTIFLVIVVPLVLGVGTFSLLMRRYTRQEFAKQIKPYLAAATTWGMTYIMFVGMSVNARKIVANPEVLLLALGVQVLFYLANYVMSIALGRRFFTRDDALVLVFTTVLRNLSISLGMAATVFGPDAALMVAMAFIFQGQSAAWFLRLEKKWPVLVRKGGLGAEAVQGASSHAG